MISLVTLEVGGVGARVRKSSAFCNRPFRGTGLLSSRPVSVLLLLGCNVIALPSFPIFGRTRHTGGCRYGYLHAVLLVTHPRPLTPKSYRIVVHVRVPLRKAALFVTPPFSAVKTPLWCIIPSRPCFPVQRPSFYPANSLMAQCICELRERDIPEPYILNPQPQPKLQNLSTSPKTLNPKPRSLNPTPEACLN